MVKGIRVVIFGDNDAKMRVALEMDTGSDKLVLELHPAVALALGQSLQMASQEAWQDVFAVPQVEILRRKAPIK